MMSSNIAAAEAGGFPGYPGLQQPQPTENWWVARWSSWLASIGAVLLAFVGLLGVVSNLLWVSPVSALSCGMQVAAAAVILAIEGSYVVSFLTFAKPVGLFFEGRPLYVKTAVYALLTIAPMLLNPSGPTVYIAFFISVAITALYGSILIGRKGNLDDMKAVAEQPKI